jgi:hypothetical protein
MLKYGVHRMDTHQKLDGGFYAVADIELPKVNVSQ